MRHLLLLWLCPLTAVLVAGCQSGGVGTAGDDAPRVLAAGNHNNLYVLMTVPVDGGRGFRFWQRDAAGCWHACGEGRVAPVAIAAWREHLLVFFPSGRWGRFGLGRPVIEAAPTPAWEPVAACQDGLAADAFGYTGAGEAALLRYQDGRWSPTPEIVSGIERGSVLDVQLVRFQGRLFVVWREEVEDFPGSGSPFRLRFLIVDAGGKRQGPLSSRLRVASAAHVAAAGETMICLFRRPAPPDQVEPWFLATYAAADEDWHEVGRVEGAMPEGPIALARAGERFIVAALQGDRPAIARLDVSRRRLEPFTPVDAGAADARPATDPSWSVVLAMGGMALVMVMLALRRPVARPAAKPGTGPTGGPPEASVLRRAGAVAIDYLLILGGAALVLPQVAPALTQSLDRMMESGRIEVGPMMSLVGIRIGLMFGYFTLAEGLFRRTLGKAMLGLQVRTDQGRPITFWQAAVRTALRPIDELPAFYLLGWVLIVRGPKAQRLGDRLAHTLVICAGGPGRAA